LYALSGIAQDSSGTKACLECHQKTVAKTFLHQPVRESCASCHVANGNEHPKKGTKGFKLVEKLPGLCYKCHEPVNVQKEVHHPVKQGHCQYCHDHHGSNRKYLVVSKTPELCFVCHSELEKKLDTSRYVHSVVLKTISCSNCHTSHQSDQKKLLVSAEQQVCYKCHNKTIVVKDRVLANIKSELSKTKFVHGAIAKDGCSGCHDPHVSNYSGLLKSGYSKSNYIDPAANDDIALCLKCHNRELVYSETTNSATGFRNGTRNLHYVHVDQTKGRNCVNCHGIHSGPNEFLLVNKVKFGNWEMPMTYSKSAAGGSCITSCHVERSYAR
jgi:predicted CXXCH cytochrome family protein